MGLLEDAHTPCLLAISWAGPALALSQLPSHPPPLLLEIDLPLVKDKETRETRRLAARRVPNSLLRLKYSAPKVLQSRISPLLASRRNFFQGCSKVVIHDKLNTTASGAQMIFAYTHNQFHTDF